MYLTNNFKLREFTFSSIASAANIVNNVQNNTILHSIVQLCENVLQPLRDALGPVNILSGYRCEELNVIVGGAPNSQHMRGEAADICVPGVPAHKLYTYIRDNYDFDQLILETSKTGYTWVHVSWTVNPRNQSFNRVQ